MDGAVLEADLEHEIARKLRDHPSEERRLGRVLPLTRASRHEEVRASIRLNEAEACARRREDAVVGSEGPAETEEAGERAAGAGTTVATLDSNRQPPGKDQIRIRDREPAGHQIDEISAPGVMVPAGFIIRIGRK